MATNTIAISLLKYRENLIYRLSVLKFILIGNVDGETIENVDILIEIAETSTTVNKLRSVNNRAKKLYEHYKSCSSM